VATIGDLTVRLSADPRGLQQGTKRAEASLGGLQAAASRLGGALAAAFAVRQVARFANDAIRTFAEAEAIWARLEGTINATGTAFADVSGEIKRAASEMQAATRFGDEEFARALQNLVVQTGDVGKSLNMMGLAADLAASQQISLESATETLGRALAGNTTQLTRMFPALKQSNDLFGDLQKTVQGMAEKDAQTLEGRLKQLNNAWGDFKEAIGGALTGATGMSGAVQKLTDYVQRATKVIDEHREAFALMGSVMGTGLRVLGLVAEGWLRIAGAIKQAVDYMVRMRDLLYGIERAGPTAAQNLGGRFGAHQSGGAGGAGTLPIVRALKAEAAAASKLAETYTKLADATGHARTMFNLLGDSEKMLRTQLSAHTSALEDMIAQGIDPAAASVKKLVREIRDLQMLLKDPGVRTLAFGKLTSGITPQNLTPITRAPGRGGSDGSHVLLHILDEATAAFRRMMGTLSPMSMAFEAIYAAMDELWPAINALLIPVRALGALIGGALAKAISYAVQAIGWFIRGIGKLLDKIPGVSGKGLINTGQEMIDQAKALRDATKATESFTQAISSAAHNIPAGWDVNRARAEAAGMSIPSGGGGGLTVHIHNPAAGVDAAALARQVRRALAEDQRRGGVTEWDLGMAY
jgi:hypothetical protein